MEIRKIDIGLLRPNTGQVEGLPMNPRQWTQTEIDRLAKSLKETPELFDMRPLLVYEQEGEYVILGGNLRYEGARKNKDKSCPAIVIPANTPIDKLKEIVIKDNGSFGEWDFDTLANEWDDLPLVDWGVPSWGIPTKGVSVDEFFEQLGNIEKKEDKGIKIEIIIPREEADIEKSIREKIDEIQKEYPNITVR